MQIFVQLLDEGTDVYRPTEAVPLERGLYRLLPTPNYDPEDEKWEFPPGSVVRARWQVLGGKRVIVAVSEHELGSGLAPTIL